MLRDEIVQPMFKGSIMALFLAFALGLFMSAWIGNPLKRLADGARQIESGSYPVLEKEGPREIQELAESFNQMSKRVQQTEESQRDFLANVSHELKTPLDIHPGICPIHSGWSSQYTGRINAGSECDLR